MPQTPRNTKFVCVSLASSCFADTRHSQNFGEFCVTAISRAGNWEDTADSSTAEYKGHAETLFVLFAPPRPVCTSPAGLLKLFVPVGVKRNPQVAAKFCQPDESLTKANLIQMAQSDKLSVECKRFWIVATKLYTKCSPIIGTGSVRHMRLPLDMAGYDGLTEESDNIVSGFASNTVWVFQ